MSEVAAGWTSTTTLEAIAEWLRGKPRVVVLTHAKPDGDAIGATLGLVRSMRRVVSAAGGAAGDILAWYTGPMPGWMGDIASPDEWGHTDRGMPPDASDAVVVCDTGSWAQLEGLADYVRSRRSQTAVIDHHLTGEGEMGDRLWVEPAAAAACVPVAEVCRVLTGASTCAGLAKDIAEPLLLGCATDTGWYRFSNTNARLLRLAADLIDAGADQPRLYEVTEQRQRPARLYAIGRALSGMRLFHKDQLAVASITQKDIGDTEAAPGDTGGFADMMLAIRGVRVAAILTEVEQAPNAVVKMSVRSKPGPGAVDVNTIVSGLGGGGHARAAGAKVRMTLAEATDALVKATSEALG
ncbi:MAG: DHH family phosphoesterase [Phycisphaeraceae bacterium]|nr:DHH family phosphoesterase [Phycisphaeraceae bacterium]MCW5753133.1 DHH family phosphoesterase [Phycisphaeraceae bacterium]